MKRLGLLLIAALLCVPVMSQNVYKMKAYHIAIAYPDGEIETDKVDIPVVLYLEDNRLEIYSEKDQIIDYEILRTYVDEDGYTVMETIATDTNWKDIKMDLLVSGEDNQVIITIAYKNFAYSYNCRLL